MLDYSKFIENSKAFLTIDLDAKGSRLSHAYLFVHKDKNLLVKFAEQVASYFLNLNDKENAENNTARVLKRVHPDIMFFGEDKNIDVSAVSSIIDASNISPFEADKKIFVLASAQDMNESSQNKILKSIEEPTKNTFYILLATSTNRLLQTILSRVKTIEIDDLSVPVIAQMLEQKGVDKNKAEIFASCSGGNGEFAEKLATDDGFVDFFNSIVTCLYKINGSRDVLEFASKFSAKNIDKEEFFDITTLLLRDVMTILAKKEELVICKNVLTKLKMIAASLNLGAVVELISTCTKEKENLFYNVNATAVIDNFLLKLAEEKVKCRRL